VPPNDGEQFISTGGPAAERVQLLVDKREDLVVVWYRSCGLVAGSEHPNKPVNHGDRALPVVAVLAAAKPNKDQDVVPEIHHELPQGLRDLAPGEPLV